MTIPAEENPVAVLSPRERQVLRMLIDGVPWKVAGQKLGISHRTVELYRERILSKLGVRSTSDLRAFEGQLAEYAT